MSVLPEIAEVVVPVALELVLEVLEDEEEDALPEDVVRMVVELEAPVLDGVACVVEDVPCVMLELETVVEEVVDCDVWESAK